jgi:hypothetical protein
LAIEELDKPAGVWCRHCAPGQGCRIHGAHPTTCQAFKCQWLLAMDLPDSVRPDRSKVVLAANGPTVLNVFCDPASPLAWRNEPMYSILKQRARDAEGNRVHVVVRSGARAWLVGTKADADLGHVDPRAPIQLDWTRDGRGERQDSPALGRGPVRCSPAGCSSAQAVLGRDGFPL